MASAIDQTFSYRTRDTLSTPDEHRDRMPSRLHTPNTPPESKSKFKSVFNGIVEVEIFVALNFRVFIIWTLSPTLEDQTHRN